MFPLPFNLRELPQPAYVVGGWVRDRLLQRVRPHVDIDLVLPHDAVGTARAIAQEYGAGFVVLDAQREIARVVFPQATVDFAAQVGQTLEEDLHRRDYTMNAIAIACKDLPQDGDLYGGEHLAFQAKCIDPYDGIADLHARLVRMISLGNLKDDPLRLLRGYRQAAQLGFSLEPHTQQALQHLGADLNSVAAERVRMELSYLLSTDKGAHWLGTAIRDGVLQAWLRPGEIELSRLAAIDGYLQQIQENYPAAVASFGKHLTHERSVLVITKLIALAKYATTLEPLALGRQEQRLVVMVLRNLPQFQALLTNGAVTAGAQYEIFQAAQEFFPSLAAVALAGGSGWADVAPWLDRWANPDDAIAYPPTLITGAELQTALGIGASPRLGQLLNALRLAQVNGEVNSRDTALSYAASWWQQV
ncbi:MAG: CCA tRNA nucleotidyltransferase [Pseudanabaenaceae cyanobacterium]